MPESPVDPKPPTGEDKDSARALLNVETWLSMLERRFGDQPFSLDDAMAALGTFAPRGVLGTLRAMGAIRLDDDGRMRISEGGRLSHHTMPRNVHPDQVQAALSETKEMVERSAEMVERLREVLRRVDDTGLERLRTQRMALQGERDNHEVRVAQHEVGEEMRRARKANGWFTAEPTD